MSTIGDRTALSSLTKCAPLGSMTSIELLQIGRSAPAATVPILHEMVGDDIISRIALGECSDRGHGESNSAFSSPGIDDPALQILQVIYFLSRIDFL
jgi:hypothetical protein